MLFFSDLLETHRATVYSPFSPTPGTRQLHCFYIGENKAIRFLFFTKTLFIFAA